MMTKKKGNSIPRLFLFCFVLGCIFMPKNTYAFPNKASFLTKLEEKSPSWMDEQIFEDFSPFSHGISLKSIDKMWEISDRSSLLLVRFKVFDNQLYSDISNSSSSRGLAIEKALQFLIETVGLPNFDLVMTMHDGWSGGNEIEGPLITFAKQNNERSAILIPDAEALSDYSPLFKPELLEAYHWENKKKKAFWRGTTTGAIYNKENWYKIPRGSLVLLAKKNQHYIDAKFTQIVQCESGVDEILHSLDLVGSYRNVDDHLKYRYLIDVDGNSCTYSRCYWILLSNSLMLKQVSNQSQWYYKGLIPYRHFVPLNSDMSDAIEKVKWAKKHDKKAKRIAEQATEFAKENLSLENIYIYFYKVLTEYARLQNM